MAHRATAIANEFLKLAGVPSSGGLTQMKLQKLVYIAHGWNLAINDAPLVSDRLEAWAYGPVYRDLYDHTKFFGKAPITRLITPDDDNMARFFLKGEEREAKPYEEKLSQREMSVVDQVWKRYGHLSALTLSQLTHEIGTPWFEAYSDGQNQPISDEAIKRHYDELARRAQAAA